MINKLPSWIEFGAFCLALMAGFVNSIGFLGIEHQAISHLTGITTKIGTDFIVYHKISIHLLIILFCFVIGAIVSEIITDNTSLKLGQNYSLALLIEGIFLFFSMIFLSENLIIGQYLASFSCGIQNAMVTTYSGAIIRTTHVTGIFTDIGILIGKFLKGNNFEKRKFLLYLLIIAGFVSGGSLGAFYFGKLSYRSLIIPASISILLSLSYYIYLKIQKNKLKDKVFL